MVYAVRCSLSDIHSSVLFCGSQTRSTRHYQSLKMSSLSVLQPSESLPPKHDPKNSKIARGHTHFQHSGSHSQRGFSRLTFTHYDHILTQERCTCLTFTHYDHILTQKRFALGCSLTSPPNWWIHFAGFGRCCRLPSSQPIIDRLEIPTRTRPVSLSETLAWHGSYVEESTRLFSLLSQSLQLHNPL